MKMRILQRIHIAMLTALVVATGFMNTARALDMDGDGVSDVEEIREFGTNPFVQDMEGIIRDASVRVLSLPSEFSLIGDSLLVTGFAPRHHGAVEIALQDGEEYLASLFLQPDDRGVFSGIWNLKDVCVGRGPRTYTILVGGEPLHTLHMLCRKNELPMHSMHFAGLPFTVDAPEQLLLATGEDAVFEAIGQPWLRMYSTYSSVVFSKDLYASEVGTIRVNPWKQLEPGKHTLYVMPYDPIRRLIYAPIVIPFEVASHVGENLKATIYYAPGGLLVIGGVFFGSVVYIRRLRRLRRSIFLAGERYPDEFY